MTTGFNQRLKDLKNALIKLKPSGHHGFEGLLAAIFSSVTNKPFRLAGSGSQHGKDGSTAGTTGTIAFEAKLYTGSINKNEVLSKLTEIIAADPSPDLWVLGATIEIKTQIADPLTRAAEKNGINLLLLDWSPTFSIPELAVACALASDETVAFLKAELEDPALVAKAASALAAITDHKKFDQHAQTTLEFLRNPSLGPSIATAANHKWLVRSLSDERLARRTFGQALAPLAENALPTVAREALLHKVQQASYGPPTDKIVALLGDEGCGKSWIFAQSWLAEAHPPLTLVIPASELPQGLKISDERDFLIQQIIRQTDGIADQKTIVRWRNILVFWEAAVRPEKPNIVVLVDGLNQRPGYAWPGWLESVAYQLFSIGGKLVISVRNGYFNTRLRNALVTPLQVIHVEQWSENELKAILTERNVDAQRLSPRVIATLRNPRVLGIAFELLEDGSVENFDELSVERLLFEHIRKSTRFQQAVEEPLIFTRRLSAHAGEILERVRAAQSNDTLIFESADLDPGAGYQLSQDLLAVSEGRFFNALDDDPYMYELSDDGLVLALGFAILDTLGRATRNGANPGEALDAMLEPITALDKTSEAMFAALQLSSVDERFKGSATTALIVAYLRLQNLDEQTYPAFEAIIRNRINAAMAAFAELAASSSHAPNDEWLTHALLEVRHEERCWNAMSQHIAQWLRCYSLDPMLAVFKNDAQGKEAFEAKVGDRRELLKEKVGGLSPPEADFLATKMVRDDLLASDSLASDVFCLLTGMPLAGFSEAFVAWTFSQAINSSFHRPYDKFLHLIRFNKADWSKTRDELLRHATPFTHPETSNTGKWAFVHLLRATSTMDDAEQCEALYQELTEDREKFEGWRLIEKYCETDPCDPDSTAPGNIKATAQKYRGLDPGKISQSLGMSQEDHYLRDACFGLARFEPKTAIAVHRNVIEHVSQNITNSNVHRLLSIRKDTALVTAKELKSLLTLAREKSRPREEGDKNSRDEWLLAQYALLLAFPHMEGSKQLDVLISLPNFGSPLLDLADVLKPAPSLNLEAALDRCIQSEDSNFKMTILMFAQFSESELSERSVATLKTLAEDPKSAVRALAIWTLVDHEEEEFIRSFASGSWSANALDPHEEHFECWYGARAIAQAFSEGFLSEAAAIERISPEHYHMLVSAKVDSEVTEIPKRVNTFLLKILEVDTPEDAPTVEQEIEDHRKAFDAPMKSLVEPARELGPKEVIKRMSETQDDFDERQERGWEAIEEFEATLTKQHARQILHDTPRVTLEACAASEPELLKVWTRTFLELSGHKIRNIYNFGLRLAETLSHIDAEFSAELFAHLRNNRGFVNIVHGPASLGLESLSIWNSADHEATDLLRVARLDEAKNDNEIAQEVLAAHSAGKSSFLDRYIERGMKSDRPVDFARALMVCGFSLEDEKREAIIAAHDHIPGLIGKAAQSAKFAYERNVWARHWYDQMRRARTPEDFWRFSVLCLKLVDGRYQCWDEEPTSPGTPMQNFMPSVWDGIKRRIKAWQDKREKTLFGEKAPDPEFISAS